MSRFLGDQYCSAVSSIQMTTSGDVVVGRKNHRKRPSCRAFHTTVCIDLGLSSRLHSDPCLFLLWCFWFIQTETPCRFPHFPILILILNSTQDNLTILTLKRRQRTSTGKGMINFSEPEWSNCFLTWRQLLFYSDVRNGFDRQIQIGRCALYLQTCINITRCFLHFLAYSKHDWLSSHL